MIKDVKIKVDEEWINLAEVDTDIYQTQISSPNKTSYNINDGHYYPITVEATDLAGNKTTINDSHMELGSTLRLYVREKIPPVITFISPTNDAYLATNTPELVFELEDEEGGSGINLASLLVTIDDGASLTKDSAGVSITSSGNTYTVRVSLQFPLTDGYHTVLLNVRDNDNNKAAEVSRNFTVDTVPPELEILYPSEDIIHSNNSQITVSGSTNDSISSVIVTIELNNSSVGPIELDENGAFSKTFNLIEGVNIIQVTAIDLSGKYTTDSRIVLLDTVAPIINSVSIIPQTVNVGQGFLIEVDITENEIINSWLQIQQDFDTWQEIKDEFANWICIKNY